MVETGARQTRSAAAVDKNFMIARVCQTAPDRTTMRWNIESNEMSATHTCDDDGGSCKYRASTSKLYVPEG